MIKVLIADDHPVVRDGLRAMLATQPDMEVVGEAATGTRAIDAGATGYLLKDAPREQLFTAIRAAARGESVLSPTVATRVLGRMRAPAEDALSSRELEIRAAVARGLSNTDIGGH